MTMKNYEKMGTKEAATLRAKAYDVVSEALNSTGICVVSPIKGGALFDSGETYIKVSISVVSSDKAEQYVEEYADQQQINAEKAAARAEKEAEKARKAAERAAKKAEKENSTPENAQAVEGF